MTQQLDISRDDAGNITLTIGMIPPYSMPRDTAIKFAMLILKSCGVQLEVNGVQPGEQHIQSAPRILHG